MAAVFGVAAGLTMALGVTPASAEVNTTLLYSADGGATWSPDVTVAPGATVLVRQWFDNSNEQAETAASVTSSIPAGFSLVGGSTQLCLNPSTTDPMAPDASEQVCAASDESSVWSGSDLMISPTAGHYGESNAATSGILEMGKTRYVNLQQCQYARDDGGDNAWYSSHLDSSQGGNFSAGTNVSNAADAAPSCGPGNSSWPPSPGWSGVEALDLLSNRYLNLHQCQYSRPDNTGDSWFMNMMNRGGSYSAGTNMSNTPDGAPSCGPATGAWSPAPGYTAVSAFDMLGTRYLNLHQCQYTRADGIDVAWFVSALSTSPGASYGAGSNASGTPDAAPDCGPAGGVWAYSPGWSGVSALDLLDTTRGAGFVEYQIVAPTSEGVYPQSGEMTSTGGTATTDGTITIDEDAVSVVDPMVAGGAAALAGLGFVALHRRRDGQEVTAGA